MRVVLSDSKATRDYYIMFSVIDTNQKLNPFVAPLDFIGSGNTPFESGKPAASWPAGTGPIGAGNPDFGSENAESGGVDKPGAPEDSLEPPPADGKPSDEGDFDDGGGFAVVDPTSAIPEDLTPKEPDTEEET